MNTFKDNTKDIKVFHLTLTGYHAGQPYCGSDRAELGACFYHGTYAPEAVFTDSRLCPECLKIWNECEPESEGE